MNWSLNVPKNPGFFRRFFGNLLPVTLVALGATVLIFMSNDGCGDRPQDFRATGIALVVGLVATLVLSVLVNRGETVGKVQYGLGIALRFFLAYTFMSYGAAKVLDVQFAGNLISLDSRIIDLAPMQMAWAFFGYTYTYQAIIGWSQIAASVLLCFRRTTAIGAILLLTVIGNIVMVNVFYEICVQINSTIYLAMTVYLILVDVRRLWTFFIANRTASHRRYPMLTNNLTLYRTFTVLRVLLILFILIYPFYDVIQTKKEFNVGERSALYGAWQITDAGFVATLPDTLAAPRDSLAAAPLEDAEAWGRQWDKLFFDTAHIGAAKGSGSVAYFSYEVDSVRQRVSLSFFRDSTLNFTGVYGRPAEDRLVLRGVHEQDSVQVALDLLPEFFRTRR